MVYTVLAVRGTRISACHVGSPVLSGVPLTTRALPTPSCVFIVAAGCCLEAPPEAERARFRDRDLEGGRRPAGALLGDLEGGLRLADEDLRGERCRLRDGDLEVFLLG
eukprot:CAMPEP_0178452186 /NCGR_PEP_ID=MMETSP0689_2-20121128/44100_1 /TAXON_ID=160604 /ORGANISM="Amphidinium massartii, Strain CS-259" /LENGTH=107 /DNA_ID=CAMNT_0020077855 /DNA_START=131 /DNA_END=451 /DNA_ORIENTATION=+